MAASVAAFFLLKSSEPKDRYEIVSSFELSGVPDFVGQRISGLSPSQTEDKLRLFDLESDIILINFWASWCEPCAKEIPDIIRLVEHFPGRVTLIAISEDTDVQEMTTFLRAFPQMQSEQVVTIHDIGQTIKASYKVDRLPETFIIDRDKKLLKKVVGFVDWYTPDSIGYFEQLLKGK